MVPLKSLFYFKEHLQFLYKYKHKQTFIFLIYSLGTHLTIVVCYNLSSISNFSDFERSTKNNAILKPPPSPLKNLELLKLFNFKLICLQFPYIKQSPTFKNNFQNYHTPDINTKSKAFYKVAYST